jgi:hypothetical protein
MVEAVVKARAEQRARVLVGARMVRKASASKAVCGLEVSRQRPDG